MRLLVVGRGKVGCSLAHHARRAGADVQLVSARRMLDGRELRVRADRELIVVAVRDAELPGIAAALMQVAPRAPTVHCAGALGPDALSPLPTRGAAHPLVSFPTTRSELPAGAALVIEGPTRVQRAARRFARLVGLRPITVRSVDRARYHLAAALVANGAVALAAAGQDLLVQACPGLQRPMAGTLLGALLTSVAQNTARIGPAAALTGPVRRGDLATIAQHWAALQQQPMGTSNRKDTTNRRPHGLQALYRALVLEQSRLVRSQARVPADLAQKLSSIERLVGSAT